jgi:cysteine-rich repeat protein
MSMRSTIAISILSVALASAALAQSDFGDAADGATAAYPTLPGLMGEFPTLPTTTNTRFPGNVGIEHIVTTQVWLGGPSSVTTLELTPNVTDLDVDDSGAFWWISLTGIPAGAMLSVPVTIAPGTPSSPYFLNVLIDQNNDGEWRDTPTLREWAVRDRPISQAPGTTVRHGVPVWWSSNLIILPKWARIIVSTVPVSNLMSWGSEGWDGSMPPGFPPVSLAIGETEDRFVGEVYPGSAGPGGGPPPGPSGGGFPGGAGGGALGKGVIVPGPGVPGACDISVNCSPRGGVIPCPTSATVSCTVEYISGLCPAKVSLGGGGSCNAIIEPSLIKRLRGTGPNLAVSPSWDCTTVGPGNRTATLSFDVHFPPPCDQQVTRVERWAFDLQADPDGIYSTIGPDEREGIVLRSAQSSCGNGIPQPPFESCDDGNLVPGDTCNSDCQFPSYFANGMLGPGEDCDDANMISGDGCSMFGIREYCGNAKLDPHEACDDGNTLDGDACNRFCQLPAPASCPNAALDHPLEQCDDGNAIDGDGCDAYCQDEVCGDGAIDLGEQCDDGNTANGDGCDAACLSEGTCGNGWLDAGEACDDANGFEEDGCGSSCQVVPVHIGGLRLLGDKTTLVWDAAVAPLRRYDVLRGDLAELRAAGGDLGQPGSVCLAAGHAVEETSVPAAPAPGQAHYYLVRTDPAWPAPATWEPPPAAAGAAGQRDASLTPCD